ncbi:MAG: lysophospholipid acyltransferase family protein [Pseudomonadota bacterium]
MRDLSFVSPTDPTLKRWTMSAIEDILGRRKYVPLYRKWQRDIAPHSENMLSDLLAFIDVPLEIDAAEGWPLTVPETLPLVIVANHPFGLSDGIVACALAEQLRRPYKVIINNDLLKIPEIKPHALPIDFGESREAMALNIKTRAEARKALDAGTTIVIFPAGGVATAANPFGLAEDLPWKTFVARLVQLSKASVLPLYFNGQNSPAFHLASRLSMTLRLSLLISEFRRFPGRPCHVRIGPLTAFEDLEHRDDRKLLTDEIYRLVHRLAPHANGRTEQEINPRPAEQRPKYPGL